MLLYRHPYIFAPHQHEKEKMLKNPHPLGLEVKIAEQEQVLAKINIFKLFNKLYSL